MFLDVRQEAEPDVSGASTPETLPAAPGQVRTNGDRDKLHRALPRGPAVTAEHECQVLLGFATPGQAFRRTNRCGPQAALAAIVDVVSIAAIASEVATVQAASATTERISICDLASHCNANASRCLRKAR